MEIYFQKGEYPIRQVIYCNLDSVLGPLFTGSILKKNYGKIDIMHDISDTHNLKFGEVTVEKLLLTTKPVLATCWYWGERGFNDELLDRYCKERGWEQGSVRIYELAVRLNPAFDT